MRAAQIANHTVINAFKSLEIQFMSFIIIITIHLTSPEVDFSVFTSL